MKEAVSEQDSWLVDFFGPQFTGLAFVFVWLVGWLAVQILSVLLKHLTFL